MRARRCRARAAPLDRRCAPRSGSAADPLPPAPRPTRAPGRSRPQLLEALQSARHHRLVALGLDGGAQELDVPPAGVAGIGQRVTDATERDVAVADDDALARRQRADLEVAHLHDGDPVSTITQVVVQATLDPGIVELEHDTEPGG